jgi:hypothetical protein
MRRPCADREEKRVTRGSAHPARKQEQLDLDGRKQEQLDLDGPNQRGLLAAKEPADVPRVLEAARTAKIDATYFRVLVRGLGGPPRDH